MSQVCLFGFVFFYWVGLCVVWFGIDSTNLSVSAPIERTCFCAVLICSHPGDGLFMKVAILSVWWHLFCELILFVMYFIAKDIHYHLTTTLTIILLSNDKIPDTSCVSKDLASKLILWLQPPRKHEKLLNVFDLLMNREPTQKLQCRICVLVFVLAQCSLLLSACVMILYCIDSILYLTAFVSLGLCYYCGAFIVCGLVIWIDSNVYVYLKLVN